MHPAQGRRRTRVRPYLIEPSLQTHALYLIGWDETRNGLRTFKIERIRDVALTPRTFEPPEDFTAARGGSMADAPEYDCEAPTSAVAREVVERDGMALGVVNTSGVNCVVAPEALASTPGFSSFLYFSNSSALSAGVSRICPQTSLSRATTRSAVGSST